MNPPLHLIAKGKFLHFVSRDGWEFVERPGISGIVGILAVTDENKMLLVEQYRPPVGQNVIEIPAGLAGDTSAFSNEDLATAAKRELLEETGFQCEAAEPLMNGPGSPGVCSEIITLFRATGLRRVHDGGGDGHEKITVHEIPVAEIVSWLHARNEQGVLIDFKVYAALYFLNR